MFSENFDYDCSHSTQDRSTQCNNNVLQVDSCVQTSVSLFKTSSMLKDNTSDVQMQASVMLSKRATSRLAQIRTYSPLPDLSFLNNMLCELKNSVHLKNPSAFTSSSKCQRISLNKHKMMVEGKTLEKQSSAEAINEYITSYSSSSSSGIDPGSSTYDSQNRLHHTSDAVMSDYLDGSTTKEAPTDHELNESTILKDTKVPNLHVETEEGYSSNNFLMTNSHPMVQKNKNHSCYSISPYLQISQTSLVKRKRIYSMIPVYIKTRAPNHQPIPENVRVLKCPRSHSQPDSLDVDIELKQKPLKSCLVKRANKRDRKSVMMKHRSWSDPRDAVVMKYSQEGQVRYELITIAKTGQNENTLETIRSPKISFESHAPQRNCLENKSFKVTQNPSKESFNWGNLERSNFEKDFTPPPKPRRLESTKCLEILSSDATQPTLSSMDSVPGCACILDSSSMESTCSVDSISKAKKSVSFSERVSYHSPHTSPHQSPKRIENNTELQTFSKSVQQGETFH